MKKTLLTFAAIAVFISCQVIPIAAGINVARASTGPVFTIESQVAYRRGIIAPAIYISNNPGFTATTLLLEYDPNVLEITGVTSWISEMPLSPHFALTSTPGTQWIPLINTSLVDWSGNGMITVYFNVLADAQLEDTPIDLSFISEPSGVPANANGDILSGASTESGYLFIKEIPYGDVNEDDKVRMDDLVLMMKYFAQPGVSIALLAADVHTDGLIDMRDLVLFMKYFAQPGIILGPQ